MVCRACLGWTLGTSSGRACSDGGNDATAQSSGREGGLSLCSRPAPGHCTTNPGLVNVMGGESCLPMEQWNKWNSLTHNAPAWRSLEKPHAPGPAVPTSTPHCAALCRSGWVGGLLALLGSGAPHEADKVIQAAALSSSPFLTVCQRKISNAQLMNKATTTSGVARVYLASYTNAPHQLGAAIARSRKLSI